MATVKDIAKLAGVSPATVSWALNGTRPVSEKTRKRIFEAVKQLNYHPKMSARSLRAGKVFSIGIYLINVDLHLRFVDYAFHVTAGACQVLEPEGYSVQFDIVTPDKLDVLSRKALEQSVDGLLVLPQFEGVTQYLHDNIPKDFPVVYLQKDPLCRVENCVYVDHVSGVRQLVQHVWAQGHRKLGLIQGPSRHLDSMQRLHAVRACCEELDIEICDEWIADGLFDVDGGQNAMRRILRANRLPSVVFCFNDYMAIGALREAVVRGIRVPEDVSIVGYDDIAVAYAICPALTTVRQPWFELGRRAARLILSMIAREPAAHGGDKHLIPELMQRDSVRNMHV
ncbi:LacI family DNA-binding transcriptional regulator [Alicyclobacillus mali (ex Roth et al. 2021)]|uniref:LacI family DNA-binding transcriptional regulator n=1 Tax=Alicyclobacillus mali (ex Roth et al. 2021) TaxID=1123961 RepID=UPI000834FE11|nr:LacI family DNA-binding transcriptional regulator [Alicyclobacillus mali (ex Roth et al. 2021)]